MESLGKLFKDKREDLGLTLNDVSDAIKIGVNFLKSIENEDFDKLPHGIYGRLFIKKYAEYLELDVNEVLKLFYESTGAESLSENNITLREKDRYLSATERSYNVKVILFLFFLLLFLALFFYYFFVGRSDGKNFSYFKSKSEKSIDSSGGGALEGVSKASVDVTKNTSNLKEESVSENEVKLEANGKCWIRVKVDGGDEKEYSLNDDLVRIKFSKSLHLILGSAGSVTMYINGKKCVPLGSVGEVKEIDITPENIDSFIEGVGNGN